VAGPQAETVTVLFTDVVGSTAFRTRVGDPRADSHLLELERASRMLHAAEDLYQTAKSLDRSQIAGQLWGITSNLVCARLRTGRRAEAEQALVECQVQAAETRQGIAVSNSMLLEAAIATADGRLHDAKRLAAEAQEHGARHNAIVALSYGAQILAVGMEQGSVNKVIDALRRLSLLLDELPAWRSLRAGALADIGDHAGASELERILLRDDSPLPRVHTAPLSVRYMPEVCRQLNDTSAARALLPHIQPWAGQLVVVTIGSP
jgi:hypothetical protein